MPEKLLNTKEAAEFLSISEEEIANLVERGTLPAYKIDGRFLRFRKEQLEAIKNELLRKSAGAPAARKERRYLKDRGDVLYAEPLADKIRDFIYFNDFYIVAGVLLLLLLWLIFLA